MGKVLSRNIMSGKSGIIHKCGGTDPMSPWPACRTRATSGIGYFSTDRSVTCTKCKKI